MKRHVFYISDSTGITAQTLGKSVLSQFSNVEFTSEVIPYVNTTEKAHEAVKKISEIASKTSLLPIIFDTVVSPELNSILKTIPGKRFDILNTYLLPLEKELNVETTPTVGKAHGSFQEADYQHRISAAHFAMENDDGEITSYYNEADVILIGVSRCGKTPTSLLLGLQFGVFAANYPITDEDLENGNVLPKLLEPHRAKLFGLTIEPERLALIRNERRPDSKYASIDQCEFEIRSVEEIFKKNGISFLDTTDQSVEEIASKVIATTKLKRR